MRAVGRLHAAGLATGTVVALLAPSLASGAGQTYEVAQCDPLNRNVSDVAFEDAPAYAVKQMCGDPHNDHAIKITNTRFARHGRLGRVQWSTGSPALRIVGVQVEAWLRRDNGHVPRTYVADAEGQEIARVGVGVSHPTDFKNYSWQSTSARPEQLVAQLRCERPDGCRHSGLAKTWLRNVHFEVADYANPELQQLGGALLAPGWHRGHQALIVRAIDVGSGIRGIVATANGANLQDLSGQCQLILGTELTPSFQPCTSQALLDADSNTSGPPFQDGLNEVTICVIDFASNQTCMGRIVRVDNTEPKLAFSRTQNPNDPELIRAQVSDTTSGVKSGQIYYRRLGSDTWHLLNTHLGSDELRARVDSTIDSPGNYEFMAVATDVAGNSTLATTRADGQPMVLRFPLKSGVRLSGHLPGGASRVTVPYGRPSNVSGVLMDAAGRPLPDQVVTVTEHFGEGALIDRRIRTVTTDAQGHWKERLPGGPSRQITADYAGTRRYLPDAARLGNLRVRTKATLRLSRRKIREGRHVAFKGRVGHLAARIPAGGKLVELEVKDGHSWQTVRHPFYTRSDGKYRLRYRFGRFYTQNVRYRFRVRVLRERGWPYKAPASSRVRKLLVKAR